MSGLNSIMTGSNAHVPAFLVKLWRIVDDTSTNDLISWSELGNSFIIHNQSKFARELLPLYYKHNNMASFVRQLNMYGFHKVISVEQGGLRVEKEEMEFAHPFFLCGQEGSLELIKRKISTAKIEESRSRPENYNKVLMDVRQMKGRQETMDAKLQNVKRENEALWRELAVLRQKHAKQQQIVSKLLQFLVSMMSTQSHRIGFKRRIPLMLADSESETPAKLSRPSDPHVEGSPQGPVIHDVTEEDPMTASSVPGSTDVSEESDDVSNLATITANTIEDQTSINAPQPSASGTQTLGAGKTMLEEPESILPDFLENIDVSVNNNLPESNAYYKSVAPPSHNVAEIFGMHFPPEVESSQSKTGHPSSDIVLHNEAVTSRNDFDEHLGEMTNGLANLKDMLQGSEYNLDMDTLSGLFGNHSDLLGLSSELNSSGNDEAKQAEDLNAQVGSEMVPHNPCLFELAEDDSHFFEDPPNNYLDAELESMLTTDKTQLNDGRLKF